MRGHEGHESFAQRHGLAATLARQRPQHVVASPAGAITGFGVSNEKQRVDDFGRNHEMKLLRLDHMVGCGLIEASVGTDANDDSTGTRRSDDGG